VARFTDNAGRIWELAINVPVMKRVQDRTGFHLGKLLNDECAVLKEVTGDPINFCAVLFVMVEPQAKAAGIDDEAFGAALAGDAADAASDAFLKAIEDFCPSRTRPLIAALRAKGRELDDLMTAAIPEGVKAIQAMSTTTILNSISTPSASAPRASSEYTPAN
jgi:hypothetical protein